MTHKDQLDQNGDHVEEGVHIGAYQSDQIIQLHIDNCMKRLGNDFNAANGQNRFSIYAKVTRIDKGTVSRVNFDFFTVQHCDE